MSTNPPLLSDSICVGTSPTSFKSLPIKGDGDLKKKQQEYAAFLCVITQSNLIAQKHLGFIFKSNLRNPKEYVHLFSLHLLVRKSVRTN